MTRYTSPLTLGLLGALTISAQGVVTTLAGTDWVFPATATAATAAPLGASFGLAADSDGVLFGGDCDNHILFKIDTSGLLTVVAGNGISGYSPDGPASGSRMNCPSHLQFTPQGEVAFVDNAMVRKLTADGRIVTLAGGGNQTGENVPARQARLSISGMAIDSAGNIFISDPIGDRIRRIGTDGLVRTIAGTGVRGFSGDGGAALQAQFSSPAGLAVAPNGTIYVADDLNQRVRAISPTGIVSTFAGAGFDVPFRDNVAATSSRVAQPQALFLEPSGSLLIVEYFNYVRRVDTRGIITTVAGSTTFGFSGDGGQATAAALRWPRTATRDAAGNIYISDSGNTRIRRIGPGGRITTYAGNGKWRRTPEPSSPLSAWLRNPQSVALSPSGLVTFSDILDSGTVRQIGADGQIRRLGGALPDADADQTLAVNRYLSGAAQIAFDASGNILVAARFGCLLPRIAPDGRYSNLAGTGGFNPSALGDGGLATAASVCPTGVALNAAGEIFLADAQSHRIRKITRDGRIQTIAGNGTPGFSGDGGPAASANVNSPNHVTVDASGNVIFADTGNHRVRSISPAGVITTIAGNGTPGFTGDNGAATAASLRSPYGVARDASGNLYIADSGNGRVRRVQPNGVITTVVGGGPGTAAPVDGLSPLSTFLSFPVGVAVDAAGRIYIAESNADRIRVVTSAAPSFELSASSVTLSSLPVDVRLNSAVAGLAFTASTVNAPWLTVTPARGTLPASMQLTANTAGLDPGTYTANVTVNVPLAVPPSRTIAVSLTVQNSTPPRLSVGSQAISFNFQQGASPASVTLSLSNQGGGSLAYTAAAGDWLSVAPASGAISAGATASLTLTATPGSRPEGTYTTNLAITAAGATTRIPVTMSLTRPQGRILISQSGLTFTAVEGGGSPAPQSVGILNEGAGELPFEAKATTLSGGNWLTLSNASGRVVRPLQDIGFVDIAPNPRNLTAGDYYAEVRVTSSAAATPQLITVLLKVLPAGSNPGPEVRPTGLIFIGTPGSTPPSEDVRIANLLDRVTTYASSALTLDGAKWVSHLPATASISPDEPRRIVVQPDFTGITAGVKRGVLTLVFDDGSVRTVSILSIVPATAPAQSKNGERAAASCGSQVLRGEFLSLVEGATFTLGQPVTVEVKVADECGNLLLGNEKNANSAVYAKFSNGDPDVRLVPTGNGVWSGTWRPTSAASGTVTVSAVSVFVQGLTLQAGRSDRGVRLTSGAGVPIVRAGSLVHSASQRGDAPVAPGTLVTLYGSDLAGAPTSTNVPLPTDVNGTQILLAGQPLPILYSSANQINAQVPYGLPVNTSHQIVVRRGATLSVPETFTVAAAQPGIFTINQQGTGQGVVMGPDQISVADPAKPAVRGQAVVIYCTGLGAVTPDVTLGVPAPSNVLSQTVNPVSVTIGGKSAPVFFSGLTPGFTGLYQVNALVPADAPTGDAVNLVISTGGQDSNTVSIAVR